MEGTRATWSDERLDDLSRRVEAGFDRVDEDLRALRADLGARIDGQGTSLGARIDGQGTSLGARIDGSTRALNARIDALQRTMIQVGGGMIITMFIGFAGLIATR